MIKNFPNAEQERDATDAVDDTHMTAVIYTLVTPTVRQTLPPLPCLSKLSIILVEKHVQYECHHTPNKGTHRLHGILDPCGMAASKLSPCDQTLMSANSMSNQLNSSQQVTCHFSQIEKFHLAQSGT